MIFFICIYQLNKLFNNVFNYPCVSAPPSPHTLNTRMGVGPDLLDHHLHQVPFTTSNTDHYRSNTSQSSTDHYRSNITQQSTDHYRSNTSQQSSTDHYHSNLSQQSANDHYRSNITQQPSTDHYRSNISQPASTDHYRANTSQLPGILKNSSQYHSSSAVTTPQQQHIRQASASPPLPPPPEDNFGHVAAGPIVPQEPDLPGWVPKNYLEKGTFDEIFKNKLIFFILTIYIYFSDCNL